MFWAPPLKEDKKKKQHVFRTLTPFQWKKQGRAKHKKKTFTAEFMTTEKEASVKSFEATNLRDEEFT